MNEEILKGNWHEIKGKLKQKWADLTDDELLKIEGNSDELYGILQKRIMRPFVNTTNSLFKETN